MKCASCPMESGRACAGESDPRLAFLCGMATVGGDSRLAAVVALSSAPTLPPPVVATATLSEEDNPHMDLLRFARACEHAGPASCGCNAVRRCAIYNRDVGIGECLACVRDGGLEA